MKDQVAVFQQAGRFGATRRAEVHAGHHCVLVRQIMPRMFCPALNQGRAGGQMNPLGPACQFEPYLARNNCDQVNRIVFMDNVAG